MSLLVRETPLVVLSHLEPHLGAGAVMTALRVE